jgi:signal transduction histidine kinase
MQNYMYSVFSMVALVLHLIFNRNLLFGPRIETAHGKRYRLFLFGVLAYYVTDAMWGVFAGLRWLVPWYVDTLFFFLSLVAFVFLWGKFVADYLAFGRWTSRILDWCGYALLAFNLLAMAANPFTRCLFYFDEQGVYQTGWLRDPAFFMMIAFGMLVSLFVVAKGVRTQGFARRRSAMVVLCGVTMSVAMVLQVVWPLTPFTSLGCLIVNCFFQVFVIQDEQSAKHAAELEDALERAHAAEKARNMFFSIVSHDIRTPLNAILGYSELLQFGISDKAEREEALKAIRSSGTTLLQLVNDVLDLSKIDSGELVLQPRPMRLSALVDEVFASFCMAAAKKGVALENMTGSVPMVLLDEHRFRQILFNLVGNAVKFTDGGKVSVAASCSGSGIEVFVSDTGCGIPSGFLNRIFDPFVQAQDPSHSADRTGGTGLGLSICKRLVEAMDGSLDVESELGKGSTFRVRIPGVVASEPISADEPKTVAAPKHLPNRVLVVDDSSINRDVLTQLLAHAGVGEIVQAGDGVEALATLDEALADGHEFDFVLTDLWMPNKNGIELVEALRADDRFRRIPVFAVTADAEFVRDERSEIFAGILLKPITYDRLMEVFSVKF